jgi:hypothetical protein
LSPCPVLGPSSARRAREGEVELGDVDPRLTEEPEQPALGVFVDQILYLRGREPPGGGDAGDLPAGICGRDVGVEAAGGGGKGVRRWRTGRLRVRGDEGVSCLGERLGLLGVVGAEVGAAAGVPGILAGRPTALEPLRIGDLLAEARGADDAPLVLDEGAVRAPVGDDLADAEDDEGVPDTADEGEGEQYPQRGGQLAGEGGHGDHIIPGRSETTRSMSLMPMNGVMTPPSP